MRRVKDRQIETGIEVLPDTPFWAGTDTALVSGLLKSGKLKRRDLLQLDHCLQQYMVGIDLTPGSATVPGPYGEPADLKRARTALLLLFEPTSELREIAAWIGIGILEAAPPKTLRSHKGNNRTLQVSVPEQDLPPLWQSELSMMRSGMEGVSSPAPAASVIPPLARSLRQFAHCLREAQIAPAFSVETLTLFEKALHRREPPLKPATIAITLGHILLFLRYIGADTAVEAFALQRSLRQDRLARQHPTRIEERVAKVPDHGEILRLALDLLDRSELTASLTSAHALRIRAAALALLCPFPLRAMDLQLRFGSNLSWNGEAWHLFIPATSKTHSNYSTSIHPFFGVFIDALVLSGRPASWLQSERQNVIENQRPLFARLSGAPYSTYHVNRCWWQMFGTAGHIARVKIHDAFAALGPTGIEAALVACTHRSEATAQLYRSRAFSRIANEIVHEALLDMIHDAAWDHILPSDSFTREGQT